MATLFGLVLLTVVFIPIAQQQGGSTYDPWIDTNDDGIIDLYDLQAMGLIYGTSGAPINKTDLLLELEARLDALNASVTELQSRKRVVAALITGLPTSLNNRPVPYLSGATAANTIVVASGFKLQAGIRTPLAITGTVQSESTISFLVWDVGEGSMMQRHGMG